MMYMTRHMSAPRLAESQAFRRGYEAARTSRRREVAAPVVAPVRETFRSRRAGEALDLLERVRRSGGWASEVAIEHEGRLSGCPRAVIDLAKALAAAQKRT